MARLSVLGLALLPVHGVTAQEQPEGPTAGIARDGDQAAMSGHEHEDTSVPIGTTGNAPAAVGTADPSGPAIAGGNGPAPARGAPTPAGAGQPATGAEAPPAGSAGEAATNLGALVVTAARHEQLMRTAPASASVVDRADIQQRPAADLLDVVRTVPGVTLSPRTVAGRKTFSIRGMESIHTLTLVDGRRISASDAVIGHSDYQYGWMPLSAIEQVEVVRGPLSALYGSEALAGVVNIISRWPTQPLEGSVTFGGERPEHHGLGGDGGNVAVYAAGQVGPALSVRLNADRSHVDAIADRDDPRRSEIEGRSNTGGGLAARYELDDANTLELGWQGGTEERSYDDLYIMGGTPYESRYWLRRSHAYAQWRGEFEPARVQLRAYESELEVENKRTNGVPATRPQDLRDRVVDGHLTWSWGEHQLTAGGEARRETLFNSGLRGGQDSADHRAVFVQDEFAFGQGLSATLGARADDHEFFGGEISPRAYLVWEPTAALVIKGGVGTAFKAPTLTQISPNYVGAQGPHTFYGNADLQPETSRSVELSADWLRGPLSLRATAFYTKVEDLITYRLIGSEGPRDFYIYDNVNSARIRGAELGLTWDFHPQWSWNNDLTLLRARDLSTDQELPDRPHQTWQSQLQWTGNHGLEARLERTRTGNQVSYERTRLPAYTLYGASFGQQVNPRIRWCVGVDNLGDLRLAEESPDFTYALRGRTYYTSLQLEF